MTPPRAPRAPQLAIAVAGAGTSDPDSERLAEEVGRHVAEAGALLVCGGLGGTMEAACRGARAAGGTTIGILPGAGRDEANPWVSVAIPTALGELRNGLVVQAADVLVAVGGEHGTLSEVALALKLGKAVVGLCTWHLVRPDGAPEPGLHEAADASTAVALALDLARRRHGTAGGQGPPAVRGPGRTGP